MNFIQDTVQKLSSKAKGLVTGSLLTLGVFGAHNSDAQTHRAGPYYAGRLNNEGRITATIVAGGVQDFSNDTQVLDARVIANINLFSLFNKRAFVSFNQGFGREIDLKTGKSFGYAGSNVSAFVPLNEKFGVYALYGFEPQKLKNTLVAAGVSISLNGKEKKDGKAQFLSHSLWADYQYFPK